MGYRTGLVLEGGSQRAVYSAGVLDGFIELGINFDVVIGTSAGAAYASSYLAGQKGRNLRISRDHLTSRRFRSARNLVLGRPYMDLEYIFETVVTPAGNSHRQIPVQK